MTGLGFLAALDRTAPYRPWFAALGATAYWMIGLFGTKPVIANHLNIPQPPKGEPTLLTYDEVRTAFHEFGHALHGMFSNVKYPRFSGTSVPRDFVEYPSQVNEMWMSEPSVLANYAKHQSFVWFA